ncbi:hypothetical protein [Cellulomonas endometrii]|uniref:hypothetical protein n=1 Tax=Cellulomonas endometrii TaxID=3036301 RepID=UPI0024AE07D2|nr:hypothetical protein [Cellulomonas endometrii]
MATALIVAFVLGDAALRAVAEDRASEAAWDGAQDAGVRDLEIELGGWPFAVGLARGQVPEARVSATVPFDMLSDRLDTSFDVGSRRAGVELSGSDGQLVAASRLNRAGVEIPAEVRLAVRADGGDLVLTPTTVAIAGRELSAAADGPLANFAGDLLSEHRIDIGSMLSSAEDLAAQLTSKPVTLDAATVTEDGLRISVLVLDVPLAAPED